MTINSITVRIKKVYTGVVQNKATLWTLTRPQVKPEETQVCLHCLHPFCLWKCLPSYSALLLFALRITVSKINLNPRAPFPSGICLGIFFLNVVKVVS